ncbi:tetratricopeptide repeat protein [Nocardia sp. NPDC050435]|uniref:tetratricopeptide repeat protein n=1 Tax=Nocardia sp. NPDC050435 TaxID=3155040 RepID=UPI0033F7D476
MVVDDGRAVLLAGAEAYQRGEVAEALRIFSEAVRTSTGPLRVSALINAASMADELGDHATALGWYREALAEIPDDAIEKRCSALVNVSQALQHLGELDQAQDALEQARTLLAGSGEELGMLRVACLLSLSAVAFHRGQWTRTIEIATETLDTAVGFAPHLAGHPMSTLAGAYFETGRRDLALDFARQALAAFDSAGDINAVAETRQNLATMYIRLNQPDEAEGLLRASQEYFEQSGLAHRAGIGWKTLGFLAEGRDDLAQALDLYGRALTHFRDSGAVLDAADVQVRLATVAYATGRIDEGETLLAEAYTAYAERGLGLHCAQIDYWHAQLLESIREYALDPASVLTAATDLAITSALAIDAVRHTFPNGNQRQQWNSQIADPAMRLAFHLAYLSNDGRLLSDLIETQCAGATLQLNPTDTTGTRQFPIEMLDPPPPPTPGTDALAIDESVSDATTVGQTEPLAAGGLGTVSDRLDIAAAGLDAVADGLGAEAGAQIPGADKPGAAADAPDGPNPAASAASPATDRPSPPAAEPNSAAASEPSAAADAFDPGADTAELVSDSASGEPQIEPDAALPPADDASDRELTAVSNGPKVQAGPLAAGGPSAPVATLRLASALADVAAGEGLPVALPPRLLVRADGRIALADYIAAAEQRYGRPVRDDRVVTA